MLLKDKAQSYMSDLRNLWNQFDPIEVSQDVTDEYDSYIAPVYRLLEKNATVEELENYIQETVTKTLGLSVSNNQEIKNFVIALQDWYKNKV